MADTSNYYLEEELPIIVTGEPTDQLAPDDDDFDEEDLDIDEDFDNDDEPYEGIRHDDDEDDDMIDDNMTGMPVVPSPS
ncbi:MAG: hypothetical protein ACRYFL_05460 [Janthinobacterium lividum]